MDFWERKKNLLMDKFLDLTKAEAKKITRFVLGIDPGPVHLGLCKISVTTKKIIDMMCISMREENEKVTRNELCERLMEYIQLHKEWFDECDLVIIEEQFKGEENKIIQIAFFSALYPKCKLVNATVIKNLLFDYVRETSLVTDIALNDYSGNYYKKKLYVLLGRKLIKRFDSERVPFFKRKEITHHEYDAYVLGIIFLIYLEQSNVIVHKEFIDLTNE